MKDQDHYEQVRKVSEFCLLLPTAYVVRGRLCFDTCQSIRLSVHGGGGGAGQV